MLHVNGANDSDRTVPHNFTLALGGPRKRTCAVIAMHFRFFFHLFLLRAKWLQLLKVKRVVRFKRFNDDVLVSVGTQSWILSTSWFVRLCILVYCSGQCGFPTVGGTCLTYHFINYLWVGILHKTIPLRSMYCVLFFFNCSTNRAFIVASTYARNDWHNTWNCIFIVDAGGTAAQCALEFRWKKGSFVRTSLCIGVCFAIEFTFDTLTLVLRCIAIYSSWPSNSKNIRERLKYTTLTLPDTVNDLKRSRNHQIIHEISLNHFRTINDPFRTIYHALKPKRAVYVDDIRLKCGDKWWRAY